MKNFLLLISFFLTLAATEAQVVNCSYFCVTDIVIDTANDQLNVTIYNGDTNFVNYPVVQVIDMNGDTVGNKEGTFYFFGHQGGDTVVHTISTTLTSLPSNFSGTVLLTDALYDITCTFSYPMNCMTSIPQINNSNKIFLYPNPAKDNFTIEMGSFSNSVTVSIQDITGKVVRSFKTSESALHIHKESLMKGMYFIVINADEQRYTTKLVIE